MDPWESIPERYPVGSVITGPITNVTDFGLFVEIEEGIEGLVHVSEISKEKIKSPIGQYKPGDRITAKVINISPKDRKIGLSVKRSRNRKNAPTSMNTSIVPRLRLPTLGNCSRGKWKPVRTMRHRQTRTNLGPPLD